MAETIQHQCWVKVPHLDREELPCVRKMNVCVAAGARVTVPPLHRRLMTQPSRPASSAATQREISQSPLGSPQGSPTTPEPSGSRDQNVD